MNMDGWAGASSLKLYPTPTPNTLLTHINQLQLHTYAFFNLSVMDQLTDGLTNQWTDKASYRFVCPQLNMFVLDSFVRPIM